MGAVCQMVSVQRPPQGGDTPAGTQVNDCKDKEVKVWAGRRVDLGCYHKYTICQIIFTHLIDILKLHMYCWLTHICHSS